MYCMIANPVRGVGDLNLLHGKWHELWPVCPRLPQKRHEYLLNPTSMTECHYCRYSDGQSYVSSF